MHICSSVFFWGNIIRGLDFLIFFFLIPRESSGSQSERAVVGTTGGHKQVVFNSPGTHHACFLSSLFLCEQLWKRRRLSQLPLIFPPRLLICPSTQHVCGLLAWYCDKWIQPTTTAGTTTPPLSPPVKNRRGRELNQSHQLDASKLLLFLLLHGVERARRGRASRWPLPPLCFCPFTRL